MCATSRLQVAVAAREGGLQPGATTLTRSNAWFRAVSDPLAARHQAEGVLAAKRRREAWTAGPCGTQAGRWGALPAPPSPDSALARPQHHHLAGPSGDQAVHGARDLGRRPAREVGHQLVSRVAVLQLASLAEGGVDGGQFDRHARRSRAAAAMISSTIALLASAYCCMYFHSCDASSRLSAAYRSRSAAFARRRSRNRIIRSSSSQPAEKTCRLTLVSGPLKSRCSNHSGSRMRST